MCESGAIAWVEKLFGDCIITTRDMFSFGVGITSNIIFLVSSLPQILLNCRQKKVEGQSFPFFLLLLTGDTLNLIGIVMTQGMITQLISATFYVLSDTCLCCQFITYKYILKTDDDGASSEPTTEEEAVHAPSMPSLKPTVLGFAAMAAHVSATDYAAPYKGVALIGSLFGWGGGCIFTASRVPQIRKNWRAQEVKGLALPYIMLIFAGNVTYVASILLRSTEGSYLWKQAPFLVGATGPMFCDICVLVQYHIYRRGQEAPPSEEEDLEDGKNIPEL
jgi:uncharacterized protein with PQ loop repeat